jgi:hypothetical protein
MPGQLGSPDTLAYMILGYSLTIFILGGVVAYLVVKARNLRAEQAMLESLEAEELDEKPKNKVPAETRAAVNNTDPRAV